MYNIGDIIIYTTYGVCKVENIISQTFAGETKDYYVLKPVNDAKSSVQIQADNPIVLSKLRDLLTPEEVIDLIHQFPLIETYWIDNENERKKQFSNILRSGARNDVIAVIKSIKEHQVSLKDRGRKLHACDEQYLKDAEKLIYEEFAYVLNMQRSQITAFIENEIELFNGESLV